MEIAAISKPDMPSALFYCFAYPRRSDAVSLTAPGRPMCPERGKDKNGEMNGHQRTAIYDDQPNRPFGNDEDTPGADRVAVPVRLGHSGHSLPKNRDHQ